MMWAGSRAGRGTKGEGKEGDDDDVVMTMRGDHRMTRQAATRTHLLDTSTAARPLSHSCCGTRVRWRDFCVEDDAEMEIVANFQRLVPRCRRRRVPAQLRRGMWLYLSHRATHAESSSSNVCRQDRRSWKHRFDEDDFVSVALMTW